MEEDLKRFELMKAIMVDEKDIKKKMLLRGFVEKDIDSFLRGEKIECVPQFHQPKVDPQPTSMLSQHVRPPCIQFPAVNNSVPIKLQREGIKRFLMMRNLHVSEVKIRGNLVTGTSSIAFS